MQSRIDAFIAEIARAVDSKILADDPNFADLWRPNRTFLLLSYLVKLDIARIQKRTDSIVWLPSSDLENKFGVKGHSIPDELERTERPIGMNTLADEFSETLRDSNELINDATSRFLRRFAMYEKGLLAYRGKKNGRCQFERYARRT
jgi:hypothetical protein